MYSKEHTKRVDAQIQTLATKYFQHNCTLNCLCTVIQSINCPKPKQETDQQSEREPGSSHEPQPSVTYYEFEEFPHEVQAYEALQAIPGINKDV